MWADQALMSSLPRVSKPQKIYDAAADDKAFSVEKQPAWFETALFGSTADLKHLLDEGLSANAATPGGTPLLQIVATDNEKVELLLLRGADVNARTKYGYSALSVAANFRGTSNVVRTLLDHGARIERPEKDAKGNVDLGVPTPLFLAAYTGDIEVARLLIQHGDAVDAVWKNPLHGSPKTPLLNAVLMGDAAMVRFLIDSGASIGGDKEQSAYLEDAVLENSKDVIAVLLEKGANVNATDEFGMTALNYAAMTDYGDTVIARQLLAAGAKPNMKAKDGETPIESASRLHLLHLRDAMKEVDTPK